MSSAKQVGLGLSLIALILGCAFGALGYRNYRINARSECIDGLERIYDQQGGDVDVYSRSSDLTELVIDASFAKGTEFHPRQFGTDTELRRGLTDLGFTKVTLKLPYNTSSAREREFDLTKPALLAGVD